MKHIHADAATNLTVRERIIQAMENYGDWGQARELIDLPNIGNLNKIALTDNLRTMAQNGDILVSQPNGFGTAIFYKAKTLSDLRPVPMTTHATPYTSIYARSIPERPIRDKRLVGSIRRVVGANENY